MFPEMRNPRGQAGVPGDLLVGGSPEANSAVLDIEQLARAVDRNWKSYQKLQLDTQIQPALLNDARHLTQLAKAHAAYVNAFRSWNEADDVARA